LPENITIVDIWKARKRIKPYIERTPLIFSKHLSEKTGASVYLKLENLQQIGASKVGAKLEIYGESQDEAEEHCYNLEKTHGLTTIKPFDDLEIIASQGTIGLELFVFLLLAKFKLN
jgi:threonine dehydratase